VYAQCVSCARQLHYGLFSINSHFKGYARALSLFTSPQGQHECLVWRAAARTKRIFQAKLWRVQYTLFRQLYCVLSTVLMRLCSKYMEDASHAHTFFSGSIHLFFNQLLIISPTHTHLCKNVPYEPWSQVFPTWPHMMGALCNRPYLKYLRL